MIGGGATSVGFVSAFTSVFTGVSVLTSGGVIGAGGVIGGATGFVHVSCHGFTSFGHNIDGFLEPSGII